MIIKIVIFAFCASLISILIKQDFKAGAVMLSIACCCIIFLMSAGLIQKLSSSFDAVKKAGGVSGECLAVIIKILAVAYATSFGADICSDAGEKSVASAVETAGKLIMLAMAFPMLCGIFEAVAKMLG